MVQTTKENRVYLSSPHMCGREMEYINEAFESNWIAPLGPNVDHFENEIANVCRSQGSCCGKFRNCSDSHYSRPSFSH